ncbi:MAG TPA: hypothetical protein VHY08_28750 [Bacillota bacterium]|nr:hypothetical protein [Bacillota bacterium]
MKILKVVIILTLLLNSLAILSAPAFAVDVNAFGHLYFEQTVSGGEFPATSCGFDLYLNNYTTINTGIAITPSFGFRPPAIYLPFRSFLSL